MAFNGNIAVVAPVVTSSSKRDVPDVVSPTEIGQRYQSYQLNHHWESIISLNFECSARIINNICHDVGC